MIKTISSIKASSLPADEYSVAQHTVPQTLLLHLLPGALITITFTLLGPWMKANHLPPSLAIYLSILFVLIPFELGLLYYLGCRRNGKLSLEGIVLYRERRPIKEYILFPLVLFAWFIFVSATLANLDQAILKTWFGWLPGWFTLSGMNPAEYSQPVLMVTFVLALALNGIAGPVVEELYFRGYLLPRMEYLTGWAPLVNAVLFSLYHFFAPWQNITKIVALIPMTYTVRWKKNIYLSMLAHSLRNVNDILGDGLRFFMKSFWRSLAGG